MQKQKVKLTFITVNYNGLEDTKALLQSIRDAKLSIDYAVVVVDNGSKVDEWVLLKSSFPEILGLRSEANLGFAGGNNLGLDFVETDYYYFINNDTLLPEGADKQIQDMLAFMASDTSIGGISPKIKYVEESNMLQYAGCTPLSAVTLRNQQIGYQEEDRGQYQEIIEVPYLHGAAMLISKVALQETGPMPEFYFCITRKWIGVILYVRNSHFIIILRLKYCIRRVLQQVWILHLKPIIWCVIVSFLRIDIVQESLVLWLFSICL